MSTNYAVFHTEKGTVSSAVIGRHIDRTEGAEYTYEHADPARKNLNIHFDLGEFTQMELHEAVEKRIKELLLQDLSTKEVAKQIAIEYKIKKNDAYALALGIK